MSACARPARQASPLSSPPWSIPDVSSLLVICWRGLLELLSFQTLLSPPFPPRAATGGKRHPRTEDRGIKRATYARTQVDPDVRGTVSRRRHGFLRKQGQLDHAVGCGDRQACCHAATLAQASRRQGARGKSPQQRGESSASLRFSLRSRSRLRRRGVSLWCL